MIKRRRRRLKVYLIIILAIAAWSLWYWKFAGHHLNFQPEKVPDNFWGVTFSTKYAYELGLDWTKVYLDALDDLKVKQIRLPVYWDDIEREKGQYDFSGYDWMLDEGAKRDVKFILVVGRRQPRWPECHQPDWVNGLATEQAEESQLSMVKDVIDHFRGRSNIAYWQLENEYFIPWFGLCPKANPELLKREIGYLRAADSRPLVLTDSGELGFWSRPSAQADILGVTMYRVAWNKYFGYVRWPLPAWWYAGHASLTGKQPRQVMVAELQAEPWPADFKSVTDTSSEEMLKSFNIKQFETNSELARRSGFHQAYFWGVEWWYWMRQRGDASFWDEAKKIMEVRS